MTQHTAQLLFSTDQGARIAVTIGLASACAFAVSNAMQHRVAGTVPAHLRRAQDVLRHLATKRVWLAATFVSFVAMLLHAAALKIGSIALVQPLMLVGVVLVVPARAALDRRLPPWPELRAVLVTVLGLGVFLVCANPSPSHAAPRVADALVLVGTGVGVALAATHACGRRFARDPRLQAALLGAAAGVLFGLTAGLLKLLGNSLAQGHSGQARVAVLFVMLVGVGLLGTALNQRAYQIAPIAFSMPLVNVVDIMVAVLFGAFVFNEAPAHSTAVLALQLGALGCIGIGLNGIAHLDRAAWRPERACLAGEAR